MIPVAQRDRDDCLCAALASILHVPLPLVPNYARGGGERQHRLTQRWLRKLGYTLLDVSLPRGKPLPIAPIEAYAIATVQPRGTSSYHAVVVRIDGRSVRWEHDPAGRRRSDYGRLLALAFLVPVAPERVP